MLTSLPTPPRISAPLALLKLCLARALFLSVSSPPLPPPLFHLSIFSSVWVASVMNRPVEFH